LLFRHDFSSVHRLRPSGARGKDAFFAALEDAMSCPMSRRQFCALSGASLLSLPLTGCSSSGGFGGDGGDQPDFLSPLPPDMTLSSDIGQKACPPGSTMVDCGPSALVTLNHAKYFTDNNNYALFVCRDAMGLFAMTAICTHQGCPTLFRSNQTFFCPCHGSRFDFVGNVLMGPAAAPLDHLALCIDGAGNMTVDYNTTVDPSTRL
jgi:nitrite reductase/ring-hydroxylating ferredoxin subunit